MDDRPVDAARLEVIGSGCSERLYSAMREQAERGRAFQRKARMLWLRRELSEEPDCGSVIDLRPAVSLSSTVVPQEQPQQDSA